MSGLRPIAILLLAFLLAASAAAQDVSIELKSFGFANTYRPGDWTAAQFVVTLRSGDPRTVQLVWEVENADGDIGEHVRTLVLNPGSPSTRWLSAKLAPRVDNNSIFTVRVYDDDDGRRGRELAGSRISAASAQPPAVPVAITDSLLAVLGRHPMNLDGYSVTLDGADGPPGMNEVTRVVRGLDARSFPDRWEGLASCEAIIWGDSPPQALELEEAEALREYIRRGGHLVIVLPQGGNPWALGAPSSHQLHDLLPQVAPRRVESVKVRTLVPILSKVETLRRPEAETTINVFDPARLDHGWEPLMALPAKRDPVTGQVVQGGGALDGAVVAIQRRVGFGRMTIVGIDVPALDELQPGGFPQPDAFWNRILGRRGDTPTAGDLKILKDAQPRRLFIGRSNAITMGGGDLIAGQIGMSGQAALGLLAAVGVFLAYWAVAGPLSFAALKHSGRVRHAWVAFVAVGAAFTLVSWAGGSLLRQRSVRIQQVTFLDHLARTPGAPPSDEPQFERAISWFTVYLPGYGGSEIGIEAEKGQRDLLASWISPPGAMSQRFPNIDRYTIPYGSPNMYRLPSRATATTLEARWLGPVTDIVGGMPQASDTNDPIREVLVRGGGASAALHGKLKHSLRRTLQNVQVFYISSFRTPLRRMAASTGPASAEPAIPGEMLNFGRMATVPAWDPGQELDLSAIFGFDKLAMPIPDPRQQKGSLPGSIRTAFADNLEAELGLAGTLSLTTTTRTLLEHGLGIFNMLPPPRWLEDQSGKPPLRFMRQMARELDLSPWFGRPCVIIVGFMIEESAGMPIPLRVDGKSPPASGVTVVRWICPLPLQDDLVVPDERSAAPRIAPAPAETAPEGEQPQGDSSDAL